MKIVVTKVVTMFVEKFVSYMKREGHYSQPALIRNKKNMLQYLRGFINKAVVANDNKTPKRYYCSWRDGQTPMTWIFYFVVLPQQDMTVIYGLTSKRSVEMPDRQIREDKDVNKILSLMGRMKLINEKSITAPNGYYSIGSQKFKINNGCNELSSIVSLEDKDSGQRLHIVNDDHCYVMYNESNFEKGNAKPVTHIFSEVFEILKTLPNPQ